MDPMEGDRAFGATIAQVYESHLVPLLFEPYAAAVAERLAGLQPMRLPPRRQTGTPSTTRYGVTKIQMEE